ncbi:signal transduction histidine kinase [Rhodopseudomonas julia]|uniref:histidine kinase n=1 Tax=Rhodopseudomonas julia TaxID=200617 RepID=A0ABU0C2Q7_9BRAD|nr:ATP-binding protein [Rhodopseudomonas julia]MDQ0324497.1 signal transduction histidine kinase [Rhodopseudomonas julia]
MAKRSPAGKAGGRLRLLRTTAFKLAAVYLAVFTIFAAFLIFYIAKNTTQLLTTQLAEAVDQETRELARQYEVGGLSRVARIIDRHSRQPGASLYLVTDPDGDIIVGNVAAVPPEVLLHPDSDLHPIPYRRLEEDTSADHVALVRVFALPGGFRLLVGRDIGERQRFVAIIRQALILTVGLMVVLGLASWLFVSRRVLKRIDSISATSRQIMTGDLSGRLEVTGTGDEFDRLALSLNTMLARIEALMVGLKQVSDNIAHDLKTPLTRMRNRVETALAHPDDGGREALVTTLEDADQLIRTFDALLMIARTEAGSSGLAFGEIDGSAVVADVVELYEPLAEDAGVSLSADLPEEPVMLYGNRELLSQALANLVDNAIKHAGEVVEDAHVSIGLKRGKEGVELSVADNGPGIPEADRPRVIERFVRLDESRTRPGFGLGLALVAAVTKLHHGELRLEDAAPGLRAVLALPNERALTDDAKSSEAKDQAAAAVSGGGKGA